MKRLKDGLRRNGERQEWAGSRRPAAETALQSMPRRARARTPRIDGGTGARRRRRSGL
jgi:hypothetical protein